MDLYVITRNIQLFKWGGRGGFSGVVVFHCVYIEVGLFCHDAPTRGPTAASPLLTPWWLVPFCPTAVGGKGTHLQGHPRCRGTAPSCTPWVFLQGKPQRWLWECYQYVAFRKEDMARKGNVGLTSPPGEVQGWVFLWQFFHFTFSFF